MRQELERAFQADAEEQHTLTLTRGEANALLSLGAVPFAMMEGDKEAVKRLLSDAAHYAESIETLRPKMAALHQAACTCRDGGTCCQ